MKSLIIDGKNLGKVIGYRQDGAHECWVFLMTAGYYISVEFINIKMFNSCDDLVITTYQEQV